ncbi:hypothetical protein BDZ89DRAFT_948163, partial [Hymenopellis radicata]
MHTEAEHEHQSADLPNEEGLHTAIPELPHRDVPISNNATSNRPEGTADSSSTLLDVVNDKLLGINLSDIIKLNYDKDVTFRKVLENPKQFKNFVVEDGLLYLQEQGRLLLCVPENVVIDGRNLREIVISEAHSILAHLGPSKTIAYLRDHVWWKT